VLETLATRCISIDSSFPFGEHRRVRGKEEEWRRAEKPTERGIWGGEARQQKRGRGVNGGEDKKKGGLEERRRAEGGGGGGRERESEREKKRKRKGEGRERGGESSWKVGK
jgi:hypothetical protein